MRDLSAWFGTEKNKTKENKRKNKSENKNKNKKTKQKQNAKRNMTLRGLCLLHSVWNL